MKNNEPPIHVQKKILNLIAAGNDTEVLTQARENLDQFPQSLFLHNAYGSMLQKLGDIFGAIKTFKKGLELFPNDLDLMFNLGNAYLLENKLKLAEDSYKLILKRSKNHLGATLNLIKILSSKRAFHEALEIIESAHNLWPNNAVICKLYGEIYGAKGDAENCKFWFDKAISIEPTAQIYNSFAVSLTQLGEDQEAVKILKKSIDNNCFDVHVVNNFLKLLSKFGQSSVVSETYEKILSQNSHNIQFLYEYACLLEKSNEIVKLEKLIVQNHNFFYSDEDFKFLICLLNYRLKKYDAAFHNLQLIDENKLHFTKLSAFYSVSGKVLDKLENYKLAFKNFEKMNSQKLFSANSVAIEKSQSYIDLNTKRFDEMGLMENISEVKFDDSKKIQIAFIVGFPRSGTTLLDTMLRAHSKTEVHEEKDYISKLEKYISNGMYKLIELKKIKINTLMQLRAKYQEMLNIDQKTDKLSIDKLPLNIFKVPFIKAIFPEAKIIYCSRNPGDAIFSFFQQDFELNDAMLSSTSLDGSIRLFQLVNKYYKVLKTLFPGQIHNTSYENLVKNPRETVLGVLNFLELPWEEDVLNNQATASNRTKINTTSYDQVIEPLYTTSIGRFERYSPYIGTNREIIRNIKNELY